MSNNLSIPHTQNQDTSLLRSLRTPGQHWLVVVDQWKDRGADPVEIGEYISALSNSAALEGKQCA